MKKPTFLTLEDLSKEIPYGEFRQDTPIEEIVKELQGITQQNPKSSFLDFVPEKKSNTNVINYNSVQALNSSSIKQVTKSEWHMDLALANIKIEDEDAEPNRAFDFGTAFHLRVLEPEKFNSQIWTRRDSFGRIAYKDWDKRKKEEKEEWEEQSFLKKDMIYIKADEMRNLENMYEVLMEHPDINTLVNAPGHVETTYVWNTEFPYENGVKKLNCKGRSDKVIDETCFIDVKTTKDSSEFWFGKDFFKYAYEIQAAFYMDGYEKLFGKKINFIFAVINKTEPYFANCFKVKSSTYEKGRKSYFEKVAKYIEYKENPTLISKMLEI